MTDDPNALRPGASIAGYNILRVLGAGGFGITYEADSPFTGKRVAIKEFFPRGIASRQGDTRIVYAARDMEVVNWALKRFESSTLDQCQLKHPNIVDVIHYVKDNGSGYMIMEYVEGETLEQWLRARESLPSAEAMRPLIEPVLAALEYLHDRRMVHRDIAPDNIMVRADGKPVIIDFGAIKLIEQETQLRSDNRSFAVMKQFYSPPEQVEEGAELDHRADIYSVGAVLYRALAGRPPASAEERMQRRAFGKEDSFQPLTAIAPDLPRGFAQAIDRALSFNASDRQQDIASLRSELGWGEAQITLPRALLREEHPHPRRSRLPWLLPLAGLAAIAIAALFASGVLTLPEHSTETVQVPPKLDEVKEIPQMQIQEQADGTIAQEDADAPAKYPSRYSGEVSIYRVAETSPDQPLANCAVGRRTALRAEVDDTTLHISYGGNTYVTQIGEDGSFDFRSGGEAGGLFARKMHFRGKITPERIEGEFETSTDRGTCFGMITATPVAE